MRNIAQQLKYHVGDRKTMVFLPLVKTSEEFAEMCREIGLDAKHIDSGMNDHDKKAVKKWFKNTKTGVLCNAMICAEGFDEPSVSAICCLRFCTSRPLFAQICGRGMRVHESKKDCILLDFMYQHEIHPLVRPSDLFSDTPEVSQLMTEKSFQSGEPMNLMELEEESSTEAAEARRKSLAKDLLAKANRKARRVDPLLLAEGFNNLKVQDYEPIFAWEKEPMTASQKAELENYDINTSMVKTKGYAHVILEWLKELYKQNRPTPKQYAQLIQHKHPYPNSVTSQQAGAWLGEKYKQFEEWSKRRRRS
jgi:superfamily II DNA or RNA helicase